MIRQRIFRPTASRLAVLKEAASCLVLAAGYKLLACLVEVAASCVENHFKFAGLEEEEVFGTSITAASAVAAATASTASIRQLLVSCA